MGDRPSAVSCARLNDGCELYSSHHGRDRLVEVVERLKSSAAIGAQHPAGRMPSVAEARQRWPRRNERRPKPADRDPETDRRGDVCDECIWHGGSLQRNRNIARLFSTVDSVNE
jgi:hypothetical protein